MPKAMDMRAPRTRSAVTNGKREFVEGNGRSPWARRFKDLCELHQDDVGARETMSEAQVSLIRRISTTEVELERMEGQLSAGQSVDLDLYNRLSGNLKRLLETIGIERSKRDITPNLRDYIRSKAAS